MFRKIAFVGTPVQDMERARRFYADVLGLGQDKVCCPGKWHEYDLPDGKTVSLDGFAPAGSRVYLALETDDIDGAMATLRERGVKVVKDTWDNEVCKMALIEDSEGNTVMVHQIAPSRRTD